jgi:hypothetical protein
MSFTLLILNLLVNLFNKGKVIQENVNVSNIESKRRIAPIILENPIPKIISSLPENDITMSEPVIIKKEIEKKLICSKLEQFNDNVYFLWENKFYENSCHITLQMEDKYIYSNRFEGKMIRLFVCNNYFYAYYDTLNLINVYTLLNNIVHIYKLDFFKYIYRKR